jgi:hypothetical protein
VDWPNPPISAVKLAKALRTKLHGLGTAEMTEEEALKRIIPEAENAIAMQRSEQLSHAAPDSTNQNPGDMGLIGQLLGQQEDIRKRYGPSREERMVAALRRAKMMYEGEPLPEGAQILEQY